MCRLGILLIIGLFYSGLVYSQTDNSYYVADTLIEKYFYRNGQLEHIAKYVKGRDIYSFRYSFWYYKNGNPKWLSYWDSLIDTTYRYTGRKNGSIKYRDIVNKNSYERIEQNRKGELITRSFGHRKDTFSTKEKYKHGQLISSTVEADKQYKSSDGLDTVTYYHGQVGGNSITVVNQISNEFFVNGKKVSETEFKIYQSNYDSFRKSREPRHFYKEFTADSILIYEGEFRGDLHCGVFREYYPNGVVKVRGWYNKKGEKHSLWYFYNEQGLYYKNEFYKNGQLKQ